MLCGGGGVAFVFVISSPSLSIHRPTDCLQLRLKNNVENKII
jgi:hypothetical protein